MIYTNTKVINKLKTGILAIALTNFMICCKAQNKMLELDKFMTQDCDCVNSIWGEKVITQVTSKQTDSKILLTSHCVLLTRLLIDEGQGEYEVEEIECISEDSSTHTISNEANFILYGKNDEPLTNEEAKSKFFRMINNNEKHFFEYKLNEKGEIIEISKRYIES